ncbi:MAG: L,D-transpeptidase family protein [Beijerinckiaceae bacterium]|nr:L,D-transpeptidase family protein [Beijerinckiaceae bacterium]
MTRRRWMAGSRMLGRSSRCGLGAGLLLVALSGAMAQGLGPPPPPVGSFQGTLPAIPPLPEQPPRPRAKTPPAPVVHEQVVARNDRRPTVHPESVTMITEAARRYREIAEAGGWPILPAKASLKLGDEGDLVLQLRARLAAEGDLPLAEKDNPVFDPALAAAVKRFQARHGHTQNGLVIGPTLKALRVPAQDRALQLAESADRLASRSFGFGTRYVVVNIPSASVEAVENGIVEKRFIAVVGKKDRASPEVETKITNVNLNPTWTVPVSIIKKDIIPKMQKDPEYLAKSKIRIYGASGGEIDPRLIDWKTERATAFTLRQESGAGNALGLLRIDMPNRDAVYMHDTPSKRLFLRDDRYHSSGCVRVENVRDLAVWILEGQRGWDRPALDAAIQEGKRRDIRPAQPIPVIWTYLTGYVTPEGTVHFRPDIYGRDGAPPAKAPDAADPQPLIAQPPAITPLPAPAARNMDARPRQESQPRQETYDATGLGARAAAAFRPPVQRIDP